MARTPGAGGDILSRIKVSAEKLVKSMSVMDTPTDKELDSINRQMLDFFGLMSSPENSRLSGKELELMAKISADVKKKARKRAKTLNLRVLTAEGITAEKMGGQSSVRAGGGLPIAFQAAIKYDVSERTDVAMKNVYKGLENWGEYIIKNFTDFAKNGEEMLKREKPKSAGAVDRAHVGLVVNTLPRLQVILSTGAELLTDKRIRELKDSIEEGVEGQAVKYSEKLEELAKIEGDGAVQRIGIEKGINEAQASVSAFVQEEVERIRDAINDASGEGSGESGGMARLGMRKR